MPKKKTVDTYGAPPKNLGEDPMYGDTLYGYKLDEEQVAFRDAIWNPEKMVIMCNARAGTGKTFVATATANLLCQYGLAKGIIYIMNACSDGRQGYLPGGITEKSEVYFEPFYNALIECGVNPESVVNTDSMVNQKTGDGYVTCLTTTYLRGTNFSDSVVILDEAQNYGFGDLKKTLTRCKDSCKVIVIGHTEQCDLEKNVRGGFSDYLKHADGHDRIAICNLSTNHRGWISSWADRAGES